MTEAKKCIIEGCSNPTKVRGLCQKCYSSAVNLVKMRKTTWDDLVSLGLAAESERKSSGPFIKAFRKAKRTNNGLE